MVNDMNYFRLVRSTDPTYTVVAAIKEWLAWNPKTSVKLAEEIWPEIEPDSFPMKWDAMKDYLRGLDPMDVFYTGYYSYPDCDSSDEYFVMDAYGHFKSMTDVEYERACVKFMIDDGYNPILDGDVPVPRELAEVLALWGNNVRSDNRRLTSKCKRGCKGCGKCDSKSIGRKDSSENRKRIATSENKKTVKSVSKSGRSKSTKRRKA